MSPYNHFRKISTQPPVTKSPELEVEYTPNLSINPDDWKTMGICASPDLNQDVFFDQDKIKIEFAKQICELCVVRETCLEFALTTREEHGVWGGKDESERREIHKRRRFREHKIKRSRTTNSTN